MPRPSVEQQITHPTCPTLKLRMHTALDQHCVRIRTHMDEVDAHARQNVASGKGGPFAAQLTLFSRAADGSCSLHFCCPISTNRVLETGIASNHAEAQALEASHLQSLKREIAALTQDRALAPMVVLFSSAQPCMACLTKIELAARHLVYENLIAPKDFILVYGASYEQTEQVAGFHDYAYALDFFNFKNNPESKYSLISQETQPFTSLEPEIRTMIQSNAVIEAILLRDGQILGLGFDRRTTDDLYKTAECSALHTASRCLKSEGSAAPWNLARCHLYTLNPDIGPLSYTECQWAGVEKIITITSPDLRPVCGEATKYLDCPHCSSNEHLFKKLSEGYNTPWSSVQVMKDMNFPNEAQKEWASRTNHVCYNGHEAGSALSSEEKHIFDNLFDPVAFYTPPPTQP